MLARISLVNYSFPFQSFRLRSCPVRSCLFLGSSLAKKILLSLISTSLLLLSSFFQLCLFLLLLLLFFSSDLLAYTLKAILMRTIFWQFFGNLQVSALHSTNSPFFKAKHSVVLSWIKWNWKHKCDQGKYRHSNRLTII